MIWVNGLIDTKIDRSGIGFETARILVHKGAKVYLAARNAEKAAACIKRLEDEGKDVQGYGEAIFHHLDLADPALAKQSAEEFLKKEERLDVLSTSLDPVSWVDMAYIPWMGLVNNAAT